MTSLGSQLLTWRGNMQFKIKGGTWSAALRKKKRNKQTTNLQFLCGVSTPHKNWRLEPFSIPSCGDYLKSSKRPFWQSLNINTIRSLLLRPLSFILLRVVCTIVYRILFALNFTTSRTSSVAAPVQPMPQNLQPKIRLSFIKMPQILATVPIYTLSNIVPLNTKHTGLSVSLYDHGIKKTNGT